MRANCPRTYLVYNHKFIRVWRWRDFPDQRAIGGHDVGAYWVAETGEREFWASQGKCNPATATIPKFALDNRVATSSRAFSGFEGQKSQLAQRLLIATTSRWRQTAEKGRARNVPPKPRRLSADGHME
ncbi:MAG: hypothetical protein LBT86_01655 [Deltaproteobacteria bacterium]|nr:hypothetical protein [Deltaproteobacteria bacterium]